ncbi:MAG: N-glycosylase/DNA lyase [Candidatus Thermoplasmatota archaeon]|nr:N-glycosylase/DNA lyase [Candidatus Thermoplasmatota archaeon]MCG2826894.1 N-glycosylase/DNA lyase [Thermoplasmatales archaeon]
MVGKGNIVMEIEKLYLSIQDETISRLDEFKRVREKGSEKDVFAELVFCILTPQSRAKLCWAAVGNLMDKALLLKGSKNQILKELDGVRFKYKKAEYIVEARKQFLTEGKISIKPQISQFSDVYDAREWLAQNVKGIGYKEASHFLRNIGLGENLAILDRHILKNLKLFGVIKEIPNSLSRKRYLEIEKKMSEFAEKVKIPMSHLDLLLWYKETGEIFK